MVEVHYLISDAAKQVDVETHVLRYWEDELELQIPRNEMGHRYYTDYYIRLFRQIKDLKEKGYQLKAIKNALIKMSGAMENVSITEEYMEEDMKAAWKESRKRERQMKERAQKKAAEAARRELMKDYEVQETPWMPEAGDSRTVMKMAVNGPATEEYGSQPAGDGIDSGEPMGSAQVEEQIVRLQERLQEMRAREAEAMREAERQEHEIENEEARENASTLPDVQISNEKMARFQTLMNHVIGQAMEANIQRIGREITEEVSDAVSDQVTDRVMKEVEYLMRVSDEREEERFKQLDETIRAYQKKGRGRAEAAATKIPFFKKKRFGKSGNRLI